MTPNTPELVELTDTEIEDATDALLAAQELLNAGPRAVLAKGGHLPGDTLTDWLVTRGGHTAFTGPRIDSRHTHGTGCTLASALACGLGQGLALEAAVDAGAGLCRAGHCARAGPGRRAWAAGVLSRWHDLVRFRRPARRTGRRGGRGRARALGRAGGGGGGDP